MPGCDEFRPTLLGARDALLIDAFLSVSEDAELGARNESKDRALRIIYLTHARSEHYFGLAHLLYNLEAHSLISKRRTLWMM